MSHLFNTLLKLLVLGVETLVAHRAEEWCRLITKLATIVAITDKTDTRLMGKRCIAAITLHRINNSHNCNILGKTPQK